MLALTPHFALAESFPLPPELWDRPRTGKAVMSVPAVRQAVAALLANPQAKLTLRYAAGTEAQLQAEELRAWLIAHAIEPARIEIAADLAPRQPLQLEVAP